MISLTWTFNCEVWLDLFSDQTDSNLDSQEQAHLLPIFLRLRGLSCLLSFLPFYNFSLLILTYVWLLQYSCGKCAVRVSDADSPFASSG